MDVFQKGSMIDIALLWGFASVVILIGQCVIVWKGFQIFRAMETAADPTKVNARLEQLFVEQRERPPFDVESLMEKMQATYLDHLEAVRKKAVEHYDALVEKREETHHEQVQLRDEQIKWLTEETKRLRRALSPQLLATLDRRANAEGPGLNGRKDRAYHLFWLSHELLWAMLIDPSSGIERARGHLEAAGFSEQKVADGGPTYQAALAELADQAKTLDQADALKRQEFSETVARLKAKIGAML